MLLQLSCACRAVHCGRPPSAAVADDPSTGGQARRRRQEEGGHRRRRRRRQQRQREGGQANRGHATHPRLEAQEARMSVSALLPSGKGEPNLPVAFSSVFQSRGPTCIQGQPGRDHLRLPDECEPFSPDYGSLCAAVEFLEFSLYTISLSHYHSTSLTSWRDLIWIMEKHIIVSFTTSITSHTVRNIWPWNKTNHLANSKAAPSLGSSSAPSSPVRKGGTTESGNEEDDQEVIEAQQKLGALLGRRHNTSLPAASSTSLDSSSNGTASPVRRSNRGGLLSELRKKFALLRKK